MAGWWRAGAPQGAAGRRAGRGRYLGRVVRLHLGDDPVAGLAVRPQPGLAGDGAAHAEARQAAEQRQQSVLVPHVLPGPHGQPFLRQRPPHGLVVHGEALRVPRPILQRPVLADLPGHGSDRPVQLLAGHGGGRGRGTGRTERRTWIRCSRLFRKPRRTPRKSPCSSPGTTAAFRVAQPPAAAALRLLPAECTACHGPSLWCGPASASRPRRSLTVPCARRLSGEPGLVVEMHLNSVWFRKICADSAMSGNVQNLSKPGFRKIKATGLAQVFNQRLGHEQQPGHETLYWNETNSSELLQSWNASTVRLHFQ